MTRTKKGFIYFLVSVIFMLTGLFFVACGETDKYANVNLKASSQSVSLYVGEKTEIYFDIENYALNMDNTLIFTIEDEANDSTNESTTSAHISLKVIAKNQDRIRVELTALSSGQSTIIATMREGFKQASVNVNVLQYSKSFSANEEKIMYVTLGQNFYPTKDYFNFDEGTTEKDLKYYFVDNEDASLTGTEFTHINFYHNNNDGNNYLTFLNDDNAVVLGQHQVMVDGTTFRFLATYTYLEKDEEGTEIPTTLKQMTSVVAFFGIDQDDVKIYDSEENVLTSDALNKDDLSIELVVKNNSNNQIQYYITVPTIENINMHLKFVCSTDNNSAVNLIYSDITETSSKRASLISNHLSLYEITISSNTIKATDCLLLLSVYYEFENGQNFKDTNDLKVNYMFDVPINIKLMPEKLEIVDENQNIISDSKNPTGNLTNEIYYNFYAGTNYGWVEYRLNVYRTTSTYSGVRVNFDYSKVNILYRGRTFNSTETFVVDDISYPIYIKGVDGVDVTNGTITFSVISELIDENDDDQKIEVKLNYEINEGASSILFKNNDFRTDGIYVSSSSKNNEFVNLYTEKDFKYFTIGTRNGGVVSFSGFEKVNGTINVNDEEKNVYYLSFKLSPISLGEETLTIRLDNGVWTSLKVTVINTFDDVSLELKNSPQVVVFEEKSIEIDSEIDKYFDVIIRNSSEDGVTYGQQANFVLGSTNADSILSVATEFSESGIANLSSDSTLLEKKIRTTYYGTTEITFNLKGVFVEDFIRKIDKTRIVKVNFISFVPVTAIKTQQRIETGENVYSYEDAGIITVYAQSEKTSENTSYLKVITEPNDTYYFYDVSTNEYGTENAEEYVFWTLSDGVYAYPASNTENHTSMMVNKQSYYISGEVTFRESGYYGYFEYDNYTSCYKFIANPQFANNATFTIYASIRQYGLKKYYPVTINIRQFVPVSQIYMSDGITEYSFKNASEKLEFTVYLNPYEATTSGITCFYVQNGASETLFNVNEDLKCYTELKTTTSRAYMISLQLSSEVVNRLTNVKENVSGTLYVVPLDWYNNSQVGVDGIDVARRNYVVKIDISFQNGTYENPYVLKTYEDVMAIGSSKQNLKSNYIVYDMIDMSRATYPIQYVEKTVDENGNETTTITNFSGSIRGAKENSGFKNINITSLGGMFGVIEKNAEHYSLENLNFEGNINANSIGNGNIGLIAGECKGNIINVSVKLTENSLISERTNSTVYAGVMFGKLSGNLIQDFSRKYISFGGRYYGSDDGENIKIGTTTYPIVNDVVTIDDVEYTTFNVVKTPVFAEKELNIRATTVYAGGIAGQLNGNVQKIDNANLKYYNYASYTVFANINVSERANTAALGGVAGDFVGGEISGVIVGGQVYYALANNTGTDRVGGLFGQAITNIISIKDSTTRTFVRGKTVGAVAGYVTATTGNVSNLKIEAIDDGLREGINASMVTRLNSSITNTGTSYQVCGNGNLGYDSTVIPEGLVTYVTRTKATIETNTSTTTPVDIDFYYGDFIIVEPSATVGVGTILYGQTFSQKSAGGMNATTANRAFVDEDGKPILATYALYFNATAYYENGILIYSNLFDKQEKLNNSFNTLLSNNNAYPFNISGESVSISSTSSNISIDSNGNIILNSPGLAAIQISNLLNRRESITLYLYVINYFDIESYINARTQKLFYLDNFALADTSEFSVISNKVLNFVMKAKMNKTIGNNEVSEKGIISIDNYAIELASANPYIDFEVILDANSFGQAGSYADGFFFSKKATTNTDKDSVDELEVKAYLTFKVGEEVYTLNLIDVKNVKAKYYEGATAILTNYSSYVVITGEETTDYVEFESDTTEWYNDVSEEDEMLYDIFDEYGQLTNLFSVYAKRIGNTNKFKISLEVDKNSEEFRNRFAKNVYGTYRIVYYSTSHGKEGISKAITIYFEEQDVNTIDLTSINNLDQALNNTANPNDYVIPNQYGLLNIALIPVDADFDYITIENTDVNYGEGSTLASFVVGYVAEINNNGTSTKEFRIVPGATSTKDGVKISKEKLESIPNFLGEFSVRYMFGSNNARNDSPEQIKVSVFNHGSDVPVCYAVKDLKIDTTYNLGITLNGNENKEYVARGYSYKLLVTNAGYNATEISVEVPTEYQDFASISTNDEGNYILNIAENIDYGNEDFKEIEVEVKVERAKADGTNDYVSETLNLKIIDYVINYQYDSSKNEDIISGMDSGVISTAVGELTELSVDFNNWGMIEYSPNIEGVKDNIRDFLKNVNKDGIWTSYVDRNDNGAQVFSIDNLEDAYKQTFGIGKPAIENYYYAVNGLLIRTKNTHSPSAKHYVLTYQGGYKIEKGKYAFVDAANAGNKIYAEFTLNSFIRGSDENPNPIYSYEGEDGFKSMNATASYILMNDIFVTPDNFEPISTAIASFDGNGHKIIFSGFELEEDNPTKQPSVYDLTELAEIGLFSNVSENTVLKNITIQVGNEYSGNVEFVTSSSASLTIGLLAANNDGVITNSKVVLYDNAETEEREVAFSVTGNSSSSSIMGALIGANSGYVTHSQSYLSMTTSFNTAGIVGTNSGHIASSFFKGGKIVNDVASSTTGINTAGFAISNYGKIVSSYASMERTDINYTEVDPWSNSEYDIISNVQSAGFVFNNSDNGEISNCYSKLSLSPNSNMAGFVFTNDGKVTNSISMSLVKPSANTNYGFASGASLGTFKNCYYLRDAGKNINNAQDFTTIDGVEFLPIEKFNLTKQTNSINYFTTFNYSIGENDNYIWNYISDEGRLELVDANIIAFSQQILTGSTQNDDGTVIYNYATSMNATSNGSRENPYVISNPQKFENYINTESNTVNRYYRIVCELDYGEYASDFSKSYRVNFQGYLFGNEMEITGISLYSDEDVECAGLLGQISGSNTNYACVKDLTIKPSQVSFVNAKKVGTLAGQISYADVSNIKVYGTATNEDPDESSDDDFSVVIGKNIVGGVIGYACDNYNISNIEAKVSTMAKTISLDDSYLVPISNENTYLKIYLKQTSFSGGVVGFLGGNGEAKNITVRYANILSMGSDAGFAFGFVGKNALAKDIEVNVHRLMLMRAFAYGGIVAGGCYGTIDGVNVKGTNGELNLFSGVPYYPNAIGGVIGFASGAKISNVRMAQSIIMPYQDNLVTKYVPYVGGIVGKIIANNTATTEVKNALVEGSVYAANALGGIAGLIDTSASLVLSGAAIKNVTLSVKGRINYPMLGNFVGQCLGVLLIEDCYSFANLVVDIYTYEEDVRVAIGELVGKTGAVTSTALGTNFIRVVKNIYTDNAYDIRMVDKSAIEAGKEVVLARSASDDETGYNELKKILGITDSDSNGLIISGVNVVSAGCPSSYYVRTKSHNANILYYRLGNITLTDDKQSNLNGFAESLDTATVWRVRKGLDGNVLFVSLLFEENF